MSLPTTHAEAIAEINTWAAMEVGPIWPKTDKPGPSHKQWMAWNNEHGAMLRIACAVMTSTKDELAKLAAGLEADNSGDFDKVIEPYDRSIKFFTDMASTIEAAKLRLLVGHAVHALRKHN